MKEKRAGPIVVGHTGVPSAMGSTECPRAKETPKNSSFCALPQGIVTPIRVDRFENLLTKFPNRERVKYVVSGLRWGFDIGFVGDFQDRNTRPNNLLSARNNVDKVSHAIKKEVQRKHTSGPFPEQPFFNTHCSPVGSAPKPDGSVRLILDLSSPRGDAVNEHIDQTQFSCSYSKFDDAVDIVRKLGRGAWLAKADIKHAFRLCPVRTDQWYLLCFFWKGAYYVDTRLPFGSRSSPFIFNSFADLLAWILIHVTGIMFLIHYLDDFFFANSTIGSCQENLSHLCAMWQFLGVLVLGGTSAENHLPRDRD